MTNFKLKTTTLPSLAALGVLAGVGMAFAATQTITEADELQEMKAVQSASVKLDTVIASAETKAGAPAVEAGAEAVDGKVFYLVETLAADGTEQTLRYGLDGTFMDMKMEKADDDDDGEESDAKVFAKAKMTLSEAVSKAVAQSGGVALEVEFDDDDNGNPVIEAETVKGDQLTELRFDAVTGAMLQAEPDEKEGMETNDGHADKEGEAKDQN